MSFWWIVVKEESLSKGSHSLFYATFSWNIQSFLWKIPWSAEPPGWMRWLMAVMVAPGKARTRSKDRTGSCQGVGLLWPGITLILDYPDYFHLGYSVLWVHKRKAPSQVPPNHLRWLQDRNRKKTSFYSLVSQLNESRLCGHHQSLLNKL